MRTLDVTEQWEFPDRDLMRGGETESMSSGCGVSRCGKANNIIVLEFDVCDCCSVTQSWTLSLPEPPQLRA